MRIYILVVVMFRFSRKRMLYFVVFHFLSCFSFKSFVWGILTKCIWYSTVFAAVQTICFFLDKSLKLDEIYILYG